MIGKSVIPRRVSSLLAPRAESSDHKSLTRFGSVKPEWAHDIEQEDSKSPLRGLIIAGLATIGVAFGGFFAWAYSANLGSAAVALGTVIVDSSARRSAISKAEFLIDCWCRKVTSLPLTSRFSCLMQPKHALNCNRWKAVA